MYRAYAGENIVYKHLLCNKRNCAFTRSHFFFFSRNHNSRLVRKQLQSTMPLRIARSDYDDPSTTVSSFSFDLWVTDNRIRSPLLPFLSATMSVLCLCAFYEATCAITSSSYVNNFSPALFPSESWWLQEADPTIFPMIFSHSL